MSVLPYYLSIGMPSSEFWDGDPRLVKAYREAHEMRAQMRNQEMWAQGIYNLRAFKVVAENIAGGLAGKTVAVKDYPTEPIPFTVREQKAARDKNIQRTLAWVESGQH